MNFSRIDSIYEDNIVCLESNNMAKGSGSSASYGMPSNKYNIRGKNNNRALNVLSCSNSYTGELNIETKNVTWYRLGDLNLNTDYPIYITVTDRYCRNARRIARRSIGANIPNDWEVRINVRPTIRGSLTQPGSAIDGPQLFRHTSGIPAKEYMLVKFPYARIFQL